jgi:hypothetical protein
LSFQAIVIILAFYDVVSGTAFEAKIHGQALPGNAEFLHLRGSGGFSLCKQKHSSSREVKMDVCPPAYIRRQCLLFLSRLLDNRSKHWTNCPETLKFFNIAI